MCAFILMKNEYIKDNLSTVLNIKILTDGYYASPLTFGSLCLLLQNIIGILSPWVLYYQVLYNYF